jgi:copper chaperone CopZ
MTYRRCSPIVLTIALLGLWSGSAHAATIEMTVNGLVCGFCAQGIEKRLKKFPATREVFVSLEQRLVAVGLRDGTDISDGELTQALEDAGYAVKSIRRTETPLATLRRPPAAPPAQGGDR